MPRRYRLRLERYGLKSWQYDELDAFCRAYPDKKARVASLYGLHAVVSDGMPHGSTIGDPTASMAVKLAGNGLAGDCELIEQVAELVCAGKPGLYSPLLRVVCFGDSRRSVAPPCGDNQFDKLRVRFYLTLAQRKYPWADIWVV